MKKIVLRILKYCTVGLVIMSVALAVFFSMKKMADISVRKVNDEYYGKILENLEIKAWEKYREGEDKKEYIKSQICKSMADLFYDSSYTVFVCDVIRDLNDETGEIKLIADSESLMCENIVNDALINFCMDSWLTKDEEAEMMEKYNNQTDDLIYKEIYGVKHFTDNEQWVVDKITKVVLWNEAEVEFTVDHGREDNEECLYNAEKNLYKTLDNTNINKYSVFRNNRENYNVFTDIIVPGGINQFVEYENDDVYIKEGSGYFYLETQNPEEYASYHIFLVSDTDVYNEGYLFPLFAKVRNVCLILFILATIATEYFMISSDIKKDRFDRAKSAFTYGVAHDMKTPLAVIKNLCECYIEGVAPEKNDYYVESIYNEAGNMNEEIMAFLEYNKLSQMTGIDKERFSFTDLVKEQIERYRPLIKDKRLVLEIKDDVFINANREYMALAVSNYISNAVKYSENDGTIVISLTDNEFSVENSCENIYFIKYKSIWDIMTVNDKSRNRSKGSSGMGLPITAEICRINGIKYGATERNGRAYFFMKF